MSRFAISLPNEDVKSASLDKLVLDSVYPSPKVDTRANPAHAGLIFLNWSSTGIGLAQNVVRTLYTFPHNYGYVPTVMGNYRFDNGATVESGNLPLQYGALGMIVLEATKTAINLQYLSLDTSVTPISIPPFTARIRFYVMAERGKA